METFQLRNKMAVAATVQPLGRQFGTHVQGPTPHGVVGRSGGGEGGTAGGTQLNAILSCLLVLLFAQTFCIRLPQEQVEPALSLLRRLWAVCAAWAACAACAVCAGSEVRLVGGRY